MISPTGLDIRMDSAGDGHFGTLRSIGHTHAGIDFEAVPRQPVVFPITYGRIVRIAYPYNDKHYRGVLITGYDNKIGIDVLVKMFYLVPFKVSSILVEGTVIGFAQDISERYTSDMTPHIHLETRSEASGHLFDPERYIETFKEKEKEL
jgi:hypothetical protein